MTIPLTGSGSLFVRLGHIFGGILDLDAIRGGAATARTLSGASWKTRALTTLIGDYNAGTAIPDVINGITTALTSWQTTQNGLISQMRTLAGNTLISMANTSVPLPQKTIPAAMVLLIEEMLISADNVKQSVPSAGSQTAFGTPTGNAVVRCSVKRQDGFTLQYLFPETLVIACSSDSYTGGATAGNESLTVRGAAANSDLLSYNWPGGSGSNNTLTAISPAVDAQASANILTNADFENMTANVPNNWTVLVGTPGTDILAAGSSKAYTGTNAVQFAYNAGAPLSSLAQTFAATSGGTTVALLPETQYAVNLWGMKDSGLTGAGAWSLDLIDGTNTVINDNNAVANTITATAASLGTTYGAIGGFFRTPAILPATIKLRLRISTAIADSGKSVYFDRLTMTPAKQLYTEGPFMSIFSGSANLLQGDTWTMAIGNTWGVNQQLFERLFGMRNLGMYLPYSGSPSIADSLVA